VGADGEGVERAAESPRSIREWGAALSRPFVVFLVFNLALRAALLPKLYFLNEDGALVAGARNVFARPGLSFLRLFFEPYGPRIIRPWQLYGFHLEQNVLGLSAPVSIAVTFAIFSLALAILFVSLRPYVGTFGAIVAGLLMSGTPISAEPLLWLSDRHDVYLVLFFACALACTFAIAEGRLSLRRGLVLLSLALWGGFYSNEKGTAVVALVSLAALGLTLTRPTRHLGVISATAFTNLGLYFLLRRLVLGTWIGGYDDRILPEGGLTLEVLRRFGKNALTLTLFSQLEERAGLVRLLVAAGAALLLALAAVIYQNRRWAWRAAAVAVLLYVACLVAAVPNLRDFLVEPTGYASLGRLGVLNVRRYWLPHVVLCLSLGTLIGFVWRHVPWRALEALVAIAALCMVANHTYQAWVSAGPFARAGELTRGVLRAMRDSCTCADLRNGQVTGVPQLYAGVNTMTDKSWFDADFEAGGAPTCHEDSPRCRIKVTVGGKSWLTPVVRRIEAERAVAPTPR